MTSTITTRSNLLIASLIVATMVLSIQLGHSQVNYMQSMFSRKAPSEKTDGTKTTSNDNLGPSVQEIHRLATQMTWQVGWELSRDKEASEDLKTIHSEMRKHSALTANLLKTYKGGSAKSFDTAAVNVRKSVTKLKELCDKTKVSATVAQMVDRSDPISKFINERRSTFKPK